MNTSLKIRFLASSGLIVFGFYNIFSYLVFTPTFSLPFPFEHIVAEYVAKGTASLQVGNDPIYEATQDPYWLFWSIAMYSGFGYLAFLVIRLEKNFRKKAVIKSIKIAAIVSACGFVLLIMAGPIMYSLSQIMPEPEPFLEAEFDKNFKEIYKSGEPISFDVYLNGYDYTISNLEIKIKDESGRIVWTGEQYIPWDKSIDGPYYVSKHIPDYHQNPIIILAPGKYVLEISLSGHTITREFQIEI